MNNDEIQFSGSEDSFFGIVDSMIEGFQVIDFNWRYVFMNKSIVRQSKYRKEELIGKTMMECYPGIERTRMFLSLQKCMYERIPQQLENEFSFPDGSKGWFVLSIQPVKEGIVVLSIDITERKKMADNLQHSINLISRQKQQLEEYCSNVSHNLRAPITNIMMLSDYIAEETDEKELRFMIEKLRETSNELNETFNHLVETLQYQRDTNLIFEKIILDEFIRTVFQSLEKEIHHSSAEIISDFSEVPHLHLPSRYASSIFANLISNGIKFRHPDRKPKIEIKTRRKNGDVLLMVSDNGLGFDVEKHKNSLFRIRKTFHRHPNARGIGLFVTRKQVESIGGKIWAESRPGEGSTFFVEFKNQTK